MRKLLLIYLLFVCCFALLTTGCSKNGIDKKSDTVIFTNPDKKILPENSNLQRLSSSTYEFYVYFLDGENAIDLAGVNIVLKGTTIGTVTNATGEASISKGAVPAAGIFVISYIGFITMEVSYHSGIGGFSIQMMPDDEN